MTHSVGAAVRHLLAQLSINPLFALLCAGALPLLGVIERRVRVWLGVVACGVALFVLQRFWCGPGSPYFASAFLTFAGATGLIGAAALALHAFRNRDAVKLLGAFVLVAVMNAVSGMYLHYSGAAMPTTFDRVVAFADQQFGFQPSFALGSLFTSVPAVGDFSFVTYNALLLALLLLFAIRFGKRERSAWELLMQFAAAGLVGSILYNLMPVCGPAYAFPGQFPLHPPTLDAASAIATNLPPAPRNGVPSLHLSWALIFSLGSLREKWTIRILFALSLVGTILATMGLGEHYFTDLIVAVPLACGVASLRFDAGHRTAGMLAQFFGLMAWTAAWMVALRFDPTAVLIPYRMVGASLITVLGPLWWFHVISRGRERQGTAATAYVPQSASL